MSEGRILAPKGLEGVIFDNSSISNVNAEKKNLYYRGYPVHELAEHCSYEEVAFLLLFGELPSPKELEQFIVKERGQRVIDEAVIRVLSAFPKAHDPMDAARTAISFLGMEDSDNLNNDPELNLRRATRLIAMTPCLIAANYRLQHGLPVIPPRSDLPLADNFYHMCFGKVPDKETAKAFDGTLTLYAEHGFNVSTFTARVTISSLSDMYSAVTAAIGSLKGPLHGGANEAVMYMLKEIDSPDKAEEWLHQRLIRKEKVMGFGHRVYRSGDSRVPKMKEFRDQVCAQHNQEKWVQISDILETVMLREKGIHANLDFPAAPTYYCMGFEIELFTPIFVVARMAGWTAHIIEQLSANRLVRPLSNYVGPPAREVPLKRDFQQ